MESRQKHEKVLRRVFQAGGAETLRRQRNAARKA